MFPAGFGMGRASFEARLRLAPQDEDVRSHKAPHPEASAKAGLEGRTAAVTTSSPFRRKPDTELSARCRRALLPHLPKPAPLPLSVGMGIQA
jgi:hypothetical protein